MTPEDRAELRELIAAEAHRVGLAIVEPVKIELRRLLNRFAAEVCEQGLRPLAEAIGDNRRDTAALIEAVNLLQQAFIRAAEGDTSGESWKDGRPDDE